MATLTVIEPDYELPVVGLLAPTPDATVSAPIDVVATITDNNDIEFVSYAHNLTQ